MLIPIGQETSRLSGTSCPNIFNANSNSPSDRIKEAERDIEITGKRLKSQPNNKALLYKKALAYLKLCLSFQDLLDRHANVSRIETMKKYTLAVINTCNAIIEYGPLDNTTIVCALLKIGNYPILKELLELAKNKKLPAFKDTPLILSNAYYGKGRILHLIGKPKEAALLYEASLQENPNNSGAKKALLSAYVEVIKANPKSPEALLYAGKAYELIGDIKNAALAYSKYLKASPNLPADKVKEIKSKILNLPPSQ